MALERQFLVFDVAEAGAENSLVNGDVQALLAAHPHTPWFVIRRWHDGKTLYYACAAEELRRILGSRVSGKSFLATLKTTLPLVQSLSPSQYRSSAQSPAVVIDDNDIVIGVTVPRGDATKGVTRSSEAAITKGVSVLTEPGEETCPHRINALMPSEIPVSSTATLVVTLDRIGRSLSASSDFELRVGEPLRIAVQGDPLLQPAGCNSKQLIIPADDTSSAVAFDFVATTKGEARVRVFAFRGERAVARLVLPVRIVSAHATVQPGIMVGDDVPVWSAATGAQPDLRLLVLESSNEVRFQLWAASEKLADYDPVVTYDLMEYSRAFAASVENLAIGDPERATTARRKLELWGAALFSELLPEPLQELLAAQPNAITIQICSDEAWIPWEACRLLHRDESGRVSEGLFFAEAFAITRWLHGAPAPERFRMSNCALVVPSDSGLSTAERERKFYLSLARPGRVVDEIKALFGPLTKAMASAEYDAWHFCGHANAGAAGQGNRATLRLEGRDSLRADEIAGCVENVLAPRPLVFFNACQSAMGGLSLTGVGGWARTFIRPRRNRLGAAVFIGTYWSVYDFAAYCFADVLYKNLDGGLPIGAAARNARLAARREAADHATADPLSWLAYTVYADPLAVLEAP